MNQSLNINAFTANGKNYRQEDRIDLDAVADFLVREGYVVDRIFQPWRNVCAYVRHDGHSLFFKMASTPGVGERLRNEITWNTLMHAEVAKQADLPFVIPELRTTGEWEGLPYYVSEAFDGPFITERNIYRMGDLDPWIDRIARTNRFFLSLDEQHFDLYRDHEHVDDTARLEALITRILSWSAQIPERDLRPLEKMIHAIREKNILTGVSHGDFVPWHMIVSGDRFALIDGEHGSVKTPRYYDVAYFYHRVYTILQDPDTADRYLRAVVSGFDSAELAKFHDFFPRILASRTIGGYFDAKHDGTDFDIHDRLRKEVLAEKFQSFS